MDTRTLRDHTQPCEHVEPLDDWYNTVEGVFECVERGCPGGKEIVLRRQPIAVMGGLSPAWYPTDEDPDFDVWRVVDDETV